MVAMRHMEEKGVLEQKNLFEEQEIGIFALNSTMRCLYIGIYKQPFEDFKMAINYWLSLENEEDIIPDFIKLFTSKEKIECECVKLFSTTDCKIKEDDQYLTPYALKWIHYGFITLLRPKYNIFGITKPYDFGKAHIPQNKIEYQKSKGENAIEQWLIRHHIEYSREYSYEDLKGDYGLLRFDFKIKNEPIVIEFQGQHHYCIMTEPEFEDTEDKFLKRLRYDAIKRQYCAKNHIRLIEIPYNYQSLNQYLDILLK